MSLLSDTQGRPERVHSLLKLLEAHGGKLGRQEIQAWLMPRALGKERTTAADQTLGAAKSLGFIKAEERRAEQELTVSPVPEDPAGFGDLVHNRLLDAPNVADRVLFEAYAAVLVRCEQEQGTAWLKIDTVAEVSNFIRHALAGADGAKDQFNEEKSPPWRAWLVAMGMAWDTQEMGFHPQPTVRLERELPEIGNLLGFDKEIPAAKFLAQVAQRMPYVDSGPVFEDMARRIRWSRGTPRLGVVLSETLRELHDDQVLQLVLRGDTTGATALAEDPTHKIQSFGFVVIPGRKS